MSGNPNSSRWSGYISPEKVAKLRQELERVAQLENIRNPSNGILLDRIAELKLDRASITGYLKTHRR